MVCKGVCTRFKATNDQATDGRYSRGQKRCQICEIFINFDGLRCPCCNQRLRLSPRTYKSKQLLLNLKLN